MKLLKATLISSLLATATLAGVSLVSAATAATSSTDAPGASGIRPSDSGEIRISPRNDSR